jgi:hypothetical protein
VTLNVKISQFFFYIFLFCLQSKCRVTSEAPNLGPRW